MAQHGYLLCSPNHDDRFVLCTNSSIRLFQTAQKPSGTAGTADQALGEGAVAQELLESRLAVNGTAFAWHPSNDGSGLSEPSPDSLVAIGDNLGRIELRSLTELKAGEDAYDLHRREFTPRPQRPTSFLHWNPFRKTLLAQGLDRMRNVKDCSIFIWDVTDVTLSREMASVALSSGGPHRNSFVSTLSEPFIGPPAAANSMRPYAEAGQGETVNSFAWIGATAFVAGLSNKVIRVFELPNTPKESVSTKAVNGLCYDRLSKSLIASFSANQTIVWTLRKLERPLSVFTQPPDHQVLQIAWSPSRSGYLAVLAKDARTLFVFDTAHLRPGNPDDLSQSMMERRVVLSPCGSPHPLVSFSWAPIDASFLTCDSAGVLQRRRLLEHVTVAFSPAENRFVWARGGGMGETGGSALEQDPCHEMRRLALRGYGNDLVRRPAALAAFFPEGEPRAGMWAWLDHLSGLLRPPAAQEAPSPAPKGRPGFPARSVPAAAQYFLLGVRGALGMSGRLEAAEVPRSADIDVPWRGARGVVRQYRSEERLRALRLCQLGPDVEFRAALEALREKGEVERAACLAMLLLDLPHASELLKSGGIALEMVALALSGFSEDNTAWQTLVKDLLPKLRHPYLRLMFAFTAASSEADFQRCASLPGLRVADRVGLALLYLSDDVLRSFVAKLTEECVEQANLEGLLLVGLGKECLPLLQSYVDRSGDVQTVSLVYLLGLRLRSPAMREDRRPEFWANAYKDLLDGWRLWTQRAQFDIQRHSCDPSFKMPPQIYAACGYCGGKVAPGVPPGGPGGSRRPLTSGAGPSKTTICQSCRKPLPRCAVCLMHLGTASGLVPPPPPDWEGSLPPEERPVPVDTWFVWCLKCRHGGHAKHIKQWFKDNRDCPVSGCLCHCAELDRINRGAHPADP